MGQQGAAPTLSHRLPAPTSERIGALSAGGGRFPFTLTQLLGWGRVPALDRGRGPSCDSCSKLSPAC